MSSTEIVTLTNMVARSFGEDIAHEVCCIYLKQRPALDTPDFAEGNPMIVRWWLRAARYCRAARWRKDYSRYRDSERPSLLAERYWLETLWATKRPISSPEQTAACWELVDRIPETVSLQLVLLEGLQEKGALGVATSRRRQELRRHARRYASAPVDALRSMRAMP